MKSVFFIPTKNIVEQGGLKNIAEYLPPNCKNILLVTGKNSAKKFGFTDTVISSIAHSAKNLFLFDKVEEDPKIETAAAAAELARENSCDAIIGLGGGSPLDAAKAAAVSAAANIPPGKIIKEKINTDKKLFFIAVPTTAGTGSEATQYSLLSDGTTKQNLATENSFPDIALLDAELTATMPENLTVYTGLDALAHAVEGYISNRATPFTDMLAELVIETIAQNLKLVIQNPKNFSAREKMLLASNIAGRVIAHTGTSACHALGYYLTLEKGLPHGLANAVLLGKVIDRVRDFSPKKVEKIEKILNSSIDDFIKSFGINVELSTYNLTDADKEKMCEIAATRGSTKATPGSPNKQELIQIIQ